MDQVEPTELRGARSQPRNFRSHVPGRCEFENERRSLDAPVTVPKTCAKWASSHRVIPLRGQIKYFGCGPFVHLRYLVVQPINTKIVRRKVEADERFASSAFFHSPGSPESSRLAPRRPSLFHAQKLAIASSTDGNDRIIWVSPTFSRTCMT